MNGLQFALLRHTLARAHALSPFYARTLVAPALADPRDFARCPVIDRETMARHATEIRIPGVPVHYVNTTTGTGTRRQPERRPLIQPRGEAERLAARELFEHRMDGFALQGRDLDGLVLRLTSGAHGPDLSGGVSGVLIAPFTEPHHLDVAAALIADRFEWAGCERRVAVLTGSHHVLKTLTLALAARGGPPSGHGVGFVVSKGGPLTTRWRRLYRRIWRAVPLDVYGVSEVSGFHCSACPVCGAFRPSPLAVVEFLARDDDREVDSGLARIVATSLYPLAEAFPVIRYDTGDLAWLEPGRPASCRSCFRFLGRGTDTPTIARPDGGAATLGTIQVGDILDSLALCARDAEQPMAARFGLGGGYGNPLFTLAADAGGFVVRIATTDVAKARSSSGAQGVADRLRGAILPRDTGISVRVEWSDGHGPEWPSS